MTAIGGRAPYAWSVLSGALPAGLSLNASTGVISGTPTTANSYTFTLRCTDANKTVADKAFTVVISTQPTINQTSMPNGKVGTTYSQTLTAANGKTPYTWSIMSGALPLGLSLNASTGVISGKPTKAGTYSFTLRCTDGNKLYADKAFIIIIGT
jgi:phage FluMu protein Com